MATRTRRRAVSLVALITLGAGTMATSARQTQHIESLPIAADGAVTPQSIPDYVAYRHLIAALAVPADATTEQVARRATLLAPILLSSADYDTVLSTLGGVSEELDSSTDQQPSFESLTDQPQAINLRERRNLILDATRERLLKALTDDGAARLQRYVDAQIKTHIVIYGAMPQ
jgi:hypothetical protein